MKDKYFKSYIHKGKRPKGEPPVKRKRDRKPSEIDENKVLRREPITISESPTGFKIILFCLI